MMKILTEKRYKKLVEKIEKELGIPRCKEDIHKFIPVHDEIRNTYKPIYMSGGLGAELHNLRENDFMFDKIYLGCVCKYCGKQILKSKS